MFISFSFNFLRISHKSLLLIPIDNIIPQLSLIVGLVFLLTAWFPYDRPDRPDRPSRLKKMFKRSGSFKNFLRRLGRSGRSGRSYGNQA